ncbi:hypothetical protein GGX14DRAFT_537785 [Mycena pura]|uniref:Phytanoyl-CoA dioxygenase family protein n=1 Tax=Mycena pura TaxID=153505 RepID=A0AAD6URH4_9AGAR|nr:hypothetical protein GGX14DRAFT_537785 [Mycena pura]
MLSSMSRTCPSNLIFYCTDIRALPAPSIKPSATEMSRGVLTQRNLQKCLEALHHDGPLDRLNERMLKDTAVLAAMGDNGPPVERDTFDPVMFLNPLATNVTSAFLGGQPTLTFLSGNVAMPDLVGDGQPVHSDADFAHPNIPFACVVNVGLVDISPQNGSTELWLGTHTGSGLHVQEGLHGERASGRIRSELLQERTKISPPFQPTIAKGSLVIRDLRLWHAGRPNRTSDPRIMLASIHMAPWYRHRMAIRLPIALRSFIEPKLKAQSLGLAADWVERVNPLDVKFGNAYDFSQVD